MASNSTYSPVVVWFRQDLRLRDNPALLAAAKTGRPVIALFIHEEEQGYAWMRGGAQRWWLHHSLAALSAECEKRGVAWVLLQGNPLSVLHSFVEHTGAAAVYWNRRYEPFHIRVDSTIKRALTSQGIEVKSFNSRLLFEPEIIANHSGNYFKVFTPFWKACLKAPSPPAPMAEAKFHSYTEKLTSDNIEAWALLPKHPDWAGGLRAAWTPGEEGAQAAWKRFLDQAITHYAHKRDYPAQDASSRLSPHLQFGEISVNQLWHDCQSYAGRYPAARGAVDKFLSELGWREFSYHVLFHFPELPEKPFRKDFESFAWAHDPNAFALWSKGKTGYPIVDAGMRELWHTGIMHNRVRMIVASFLTKDLMLSWQEGARWFWDTLVDADLASNSASWQWVAGCGADAAPYFRIFNPALQSAKFDSHGEYIRRWVAELARLPDAMIHAPWQYSGEQLKRHGVTLGKDYPAPLVDHDTARKRALEYYRELRGAT